jgi:hypothetical protein
LAPAGAGFLIDDYLPTLKHVQNITGPVLAGLGTQTLSNSPKFLERYLVVSLKETDHS